MRIYRGVRSAVCAAAVFLSGLLAATPSGVAQNVFSDLFSWIAKPNPPKVRPVERSEDPYGLAPRSYGPRMSYRSSRYRTVCVRLCDGYYFPISNSSSRNRFHGDAEQCQSRCQGAAKLYYMPRGAADINSALDISGKPYKRLENAFLYRKKYVANCACRPAPWSPEERARHAMYDSPAPQVTINDEVLDKVAANMQPDPSAADAQGGQNPYEKAEKAPHTPNPYVVGKKRIPNKPSTLGVKVKGKQLATAKRRRNKRVNSRGGVQGSGPSFLWPGDGS